MRVEVFPDWPEAVATRWAEMLRPGLRMCLPTGATPAPVYSRMLLGFDHTTVFVLDEYGGLPKGHPARCSSMIADQLVAHLAIDVNFHWVG